MAQLQQISPQSQPCHHVAQTERMQPKLHKHFAFIFNECNLEHQVQPCHQLQAQICQFIHHWTVASIQR